MKVASVCPGCGRPASSKGRSVCLYCGAALTPVATGKVSAAGSGRPIDVPEPLLKTAPAPPAAPGPKPSWHHLAPEKGPFRAFLGQTWVKVALVVAFLLLAILGLGRLIDSRRPPGYSDAPAWR